MSRITCALWEPKTPETKWQIFVRSTRLSLPTCAGRVCRSPAGRIALRGSSRLPEMRELTTLSNGLLLCALVAILRNCNVSLSFPVCSAFALLVCSSGRTTMFAFASVTVLKCLYSYIYCNRPLIALQCSFRCHCAGNGQHAASGSRTQALCAVRAARRGQTLYARRQVQYYRHRCVPRAEAVRPASSGGAPTFSAVRRGHAL